MAFSIPSVNILPRLPRWVSHWFGYRPTPPKPLPQYLVWIWSFFAAFCGLCVLQAIFNYSSYFERRHVPGIVASFVSLFFHFQPLHGPFTANQICFGHLQRQLSTVKFM